MGTGIGIKYSHNLFHSAIVGNLARSSSDPENGKHSQLVRSIRLRHSSFRLCFVNLQICEMTPERQFIWQHCCLRLPEYEVNGSRDMISCRILNVIQRDAPSLFQLL